MRPLIIAALLCTYSACSCGSNDCTSVGTGGFGGSTGNETQLGYVGKPLTIDIDVVETLAGCDPAALQVTNAVVEVLDPSNQKVAATVTQPVEAGGEVTCTVTFTPATPGPYHVAVRLAPNGGTVQRDVEAAVDRRTLAPSTFPLGADDPQCEQIDFDAQTLLCLDPNDPSGPKLRTKRLDGSGQGVTISRVPATAFALTEGKVWVFALSNSLTLYGLGSDGSLAFKGNAALVTQGARPKLFAQGDQAFFIDDQGFQQLSALPDGGILSSGITPLQNATGGQWLPGVGATVFSDFQTLCSWPLTAGVAPDADAGSCTFLDSLSVKGYDDDGIWWVDPKAPVLTGQTVFVSGWHAGQDHPTSGALTFLGAQLLTDPTGSTPQSSLLLTVMNSAGDTIDLLAPRFDGKLAWFEHYPTIDPVEQTHADSRYIWFIDDGVLTYYRR